MKDKFEQRNGATQCKLLKGVGTGKVLRECSACVADAAEFLASACCFLLSIIACMFLKFLMQRYGFYYRRTNEIVYVIIDKYYCK